jgi:glycosyltransferase involved in cell wall biosynthesis
MTAPGGRMRVSVVLEGRFCRARDGSVWSSAAFPLAFWSRYLDVFEEVSVVARVGSAEPREGDVRSDGPRVTFVPVPYYVGPWQYLAKRRSVGAALRGALEAPGAVIMRVASELANLAWPMLARARRPYALEVVGDPWDAFAPGVVRHPLRPILRRYFRWHLRRQCTGAAAAAYVTEAALQRRYPLERGRAAPYSSAFLNPSGTDARPSRAFVASDVVVPEGEPSQRASTSSASGWRLVFVGSLEQLYKGPDVLLRALAVCRKRGLPCVLRLVGDGRCRPKLEHLALRLGLGEAVQFVGTLPAGEAVFREVGEADLFVLPSRTEGLPRALIEAMALGLPCIATNVGGIPELLAAEDLVAPGDVEGLAREILSTLADPPRRERMRERNRRRAADFTEAVLAPRRRAFYEYVREVTAEWAASSPGAPSR